MIRSKVSNNFINRLIKEDSDFEYAKNFFKRFIYRPELTLCSLLVLSIVFLITSMDDLIFNSTITNLNKVISTLLFAISMITIIDLSRKLLILLLVGNHEAISRDYELESEAMNLLKIKSDGEFATIESFTMNIKMNSLHGIIDYDVIEGMSVGEFLISENKFKANWIRSSDKNRPSLVDLLCLFDFLIKGDVFDFKNKDREELLKFIKSKFNVRGNEINLNSLNKTYSKLKKEKQEKRNEYDKRMSRLIFDLKS